MAQGGQQGQADNSLGFLWILVALFTGVLLTWFTAHSAIVTVVFKLRIAELFFAGLISEEARKLSQLIAAAPTASVSFTTLMAVSNEVGRYYRIPVMLILFGCAFFSFRGSAELKFKKTYSMKSLLAQEKQNWPYITAVEGKNLVNIDIEEGPWAMAMSPVAFCRKYKLLDVVQQKAKEDELLKDVHIQANLVRGKANKVFAKQVGRLWKGYDKLRPHAQALFAIFIAKAEAESEVAEKLLRQLSASCGRQIPLPTFHSLYEKYQNSKILRKILADHAFENTVMMSMLEASRMDGVLASSEFLWLKPIDRNLWFILNSVGRQTPVCEAAGVMAHWLAEREMGKPLQLPMVQQATLALEEALSEIIYIPAEGEVVREE